MGASCFVKFFLGKICKINIYRSIESKLVKNRTKTEVVGGNLARLVNFAPSLTSFSVYLYNTTTRCIDRSVQAPDNH